MEYLAWEEVAFGAWTATRALSSNLSSPWLKLTVMKKKSCAINRYLYNNLINARALIGQSAMFYLLCR